MHFGFLQNEFSLKSVLLILSKVDTVAVNENINGSPYCLLVDWTMKRYVELDGEENDYSCWGCAKKFSHRLALMKKRGKRASGLWCESASGQ